MFLKCSIQQLHFYKNWVFVHCTFSFFLRFADALGYFLFNCRIFIKLSINQVLQSLKIIIWYNKNIIWYKYLLLFDRVFSELFGRNFNKQFFRQITFKLQLLLRASLKAKYLQVSFCRGSLKAEYLLMICFVVHYMSG